MVCIRHDDSEEAFYLPNWIMVMVLLTLYLGRWLHATIQVVATNG